LRSVGLQPPDYAFQKAFGAAVPHRILLGLFPVCRD
jgi:hypothetical protein